MFYVKVILALFAGSFFFALNISLSAGWNADSTRPEVLELRVKITLACADCKQRNYTNIKNKKNDPDRIEMKKYCKFCHKHTVHKETK